MSIKKGEKHDRVPPLSDKYGTRSPSRPLCAGHIEDWDVVFAAALHSANENGGADQAIGGRRLSPCAPPRPSAITPACPLVPECILSLGEEIRDRRGESPLPAVVPPRRKISDGRDLQLTAVPVIGPFSRCRHFSPERAGVPPAPGSSTC